MSSSTSGSGAAVAAPQTLSAMVKRKAAVASWVLVGPPAEEGADEWTYRTQTTHTVRDDAGGVVTLDDTFVVYPMRKRPGPFMDTLLIGRAASNDVCIVHKNVSKLHARARFVDGKWLLVDAGSSNGTAVNDAVLAAGEERVLQHGDHIRFGGVHFQLFDPEQFASILARIALA